MFSELPAWSEATAGREPSLLSPSELSLSTSLSPWRAGDFEMTERGQGGTNRSIAGSEHRAAFDRLFTRTCKAQEQVAGDGRATLLK